MKYYTPEIEEFHIGFEYEWLDDEEGGDNWIKANTPTTIELEGYEDITYGLRVKYLDKEDIESLGFKEDTLHFYSKHQKEGVVLYIEKIVLTNENNFWYKIWLKHPSYGNSTIYSGSIKNKSELKKLLKQLNVE
ncbi:hypothetical protein N356_gp101 [Cellulophaga phage phi14:2]|uniref:Uncharacterized protein n=1 Tax=Cellulophaga phage phi14:2 TaxID=1327990 RepID=S0A0A3_9CAUD|nr:hypothetical protein N356_gp101 [Cellulophaga phage phi14:2]AGO48994.1 hypothetical protein Phi14:2_gp116 [Cellulophaga phage phi14:2]